MHLSSSSTVVLALLLVAACGTDPSDPPPVYEIRVTVVDSAGLPHVGIPMGVNVWHEDTETWYFDSTDSHGLAVLRDTTDGHAPDSMVVYTPLSGFCWGQDNFTTGTVFPPANGKSSILNVVVHRFPHARAIAGEYCGTGATGDGFDRFYAYLYIDSVTAGSVYGQWAIAYATTRRTEDGPFTGSVTSSILALDLRPDGDDPDCDAHYRLVAPIVNDSLGLASLQALGGCTVSPAEFQMFAGDEFFFPRVRPIR